jgi:YgiT-type zinc finger domain-containing protein
MKCVFCKIGETRAQRVTVEKYSETGELVALVRNFPAEVCDRCGEEYYQKGDWEKVEQLLAEDAPPATTLRIPVYALSV